MELSEFIKQKVKEKKMTMRELAQKSNITPSYLSHILSNRRNMTAENFSNIAKALKLCDYELFIFHSLNIKEHRGSEKINIPETANDYEIIGILEANDHVIDDNLRKEIMQILTKSIYGIDSEWDADSENIDSFEKIVEVALKFTVLKDFITAKRFLFKALREYDKEKINIEVTGYLKAISEFSEPGTELNLLALRMIDISKNK